MSCCGALYPYPDDLVIVSKVGAARDDRGQWYGAQRPDQLRAGVEANRIPRLGQIPVVNLRRHPESDVLFTEQVEAMESLRQEGLIGAIGLSNVDLDQYRTAQTLSTSRASRTPTTWRIPQGRASYRLQNGRCCLCAVFSVGLGLQPREPSARRSPRPGYGGSTRCNTGSSCACLVAQPGSDRIAYPWNFVTRTFGRESCCSRSGPRPRGA